MCGPWYLGEVTSIHRGVVVVYGTVYNTKRPYKLPLHRAKVFFVFFLDLDCFFPDDDVACKNVNGPFFRCG